MHVLLVEPAYRTRYPPLGLLKLASYHRSKGDTVELVRGCMRPRRRPARIYVTSLFTWAWKPVWDAVRYYKNIFPDVDLWLGGIYASLLPEHARESGADHICVGFIPEIEDLMPAYDLVPEWDGSLIYSSRGCNRRCPHCAVWKIEGSINSCRKTIRHLVYPSHTRIIIWDNNILQNPYWRDIFDELIWFSSKNKRIDFNQGIDARLITDEVAAKIAKMKLKYIRISYDNRKVGKYVKKAIEKLSAYFSRRKIIVYMLYNFKDSPDDLFARMRDVLEWGAVVYPMRYEPLNALQRWKYVSPGWSAEELERVEDFRRVYGYGGALPPYKWLVERFTSSESFEEAFELPEPHKHKKRVRKPYYDAWHREEEWRKVIEKIKRK